MTKIEGPCLIDSIMIGEAQIEYFGAPKLSAKYALSNAESGYRFGQGNCNLWSPRTMERLASLIESMELDLTASITVMGKESSVQTPQSNVVEDDKVPSL